MSNGSKISFVVVANESATKRHLTMPSNSRRRVSMRKDRSETMVAKQCELASTWPTPKKNMFCNDAKCKKQFLMNFRIGLISDPFRIDSICLSCNAASSIFESSTESIHFVFWFKIVLRSMQNASAIKRANASAPLHCLVAAPCSPYMSTTHKPNIFAVKTAVCAN